MIWVPRSAAVALLAVALFAATGCEEEAETTQVPTVQTTQITPPPPARLTRAERRTVARYESRIQVHCVRVARSLVNPSAAPTVRQETRAFAAAKGLVALAAEKPTAPFGPGQDLRLFVSDVAENLEGSNCDPRMIARLEQGLARLTP